MKKGTPAELAALLGCGHPIERVTLNSMPLSATEPKMKLTVWPSDVLHCETCNTVLVIGKTALFAKVPKKTKGEPCVS